MPYWGNCFDNHLLVLLLRKFLCQCNFVQCVFYHPMPLSCYRVQSIYIISICNSVDCNYNVTNCCSHCCSRACVCIVLIQRINCTSHIVKWGVKCYQRLWAVNDFLQHLDYWIIDLYVVWDFHQTQSLYLGLRWSSF